MLTDIQIFILLLLLGGALYLIWQIHKEKKDIAGMIIAWLYCCFGSIVVVTALMITLNRMKAQESELPDIPQYRLVNLGDSIYVKNK